jgi:hypothetical protein
MLMYESGSNALQRGRAALLCIEDRLARAHRRLTAAVLLQAQCARADDESAEDATPRASRLKMVSDLSLFTNPYSQLLLLAEGLGLCARKPFIG